MSLDFVPWACGIAHNHVRNFYRKRQNSQVHLDADVVEMLATRSSQLRQRDDEKIGALRACLNELTERNRGIVENYYGGMSVQEIATQRDLSANAIYKLLDRVREALHGCVNLRLAEGAAS
jgi:RNA polymerase sigma-70 factor (ECF subfamily)